MALTLFIPPNTPISSSQNSIPPPISLSNLLQTIPDLKSLKQVHGQIIKSQTQQTLQVANKLISLYSLFDQMDFAELTFQRTPTKQSFTYNMMIRGFSSHGYPQKALDFYSQMLYSNCTPDKFTFPFVLKGYSALLDLALEAREAHGRILKTGLSGDVYVSTALTDMYLKMGEIDNARHVFEGITQRSVVTWNAMIAGYSYNGLDLEAVATFKLMIGLGFEPNSSTMVAVLPAIARVGDLDEGSFIHGWIVEKEMEQDESVRNTLIAMYGKFRELDRARKLFDEMHNKTDVSWTAIISAYAQEGIVSEALDLFHGMQILGTKPTAITIASILPACADFVDLKLGMKIHGYSIRSGFDFDLVVSTALVDMYGKCGYIEEAERVFSKMPEKNVVSWNTMINAYGLHGQGGNALELFSQMQIEGTKPNSSTFVSIISACSHAGMVTDGLKCFNSMSNDCNIIPETKHYACIVDLLGRAGNLKEAYEIIENMPIKPDDVVWGALLGACRIHKNVEIGELAAKRVFQLKPDEPGYYVLLANIYAAEQRWNDVQNLREVMRMRNVKKEAGWSSIEEGSVVHSFIAGDFKHREWEEIHMKMEEIRDRLREEGYVPDTSFVLHEVEEVVKDERLSIHSERMALAFGLIKIGSGVPIRITKNLRICGDCHSAFKIVSRVYGKEIIVRDSNRFHRFNSGSCSCNDYW